MDGFEEVYNGLGDLKKHLAELAGMEVLVGVPESEAERKDGEGINNASLAYIHENGSPEANIPARPFMTQGIAAASKAISDGFEDAGRAILDGDDKKAHKALHKVGLKTQSTIQNTIRNGDFQQLSERTLAARRARGVKRTKPLIDTGALLQSISYVVKG